MAGAFAERQLIDLGGMKPAKVEFAIAGPADDAGLRELLRETPTPGPVSLSFEREPSYFAGENVAGAADTTVVARMDGRPICMGRCSRRILYLEGEPRDVGYLGELRLAPGARSGSAVLRAGYAFFAGREAERPADLYFTSVAVSNRRARTVLESGRSGLPRYTPLGDLATVAWPVAARTASDEAEDGAGEEELTVFLDTQARHRALAMPWNAQAWRSFGRHGLVAADFSVVRRKGRIVAAAGVWDQSLWRQTVVRGYAGMTGRLRPLINGLARLAGQPGLPPVGARLRQACVHPLAVAEDATELLGELMGKLETRALVRGVEWLVASVAPQDGLLPALCRRPGARRYATRLYAVRLPGLAGRRKDLNGQIARPEPGLL